MLRRLMTAQRIFRKSLCCLYWSCLKLLSRESCLHQAANRHWDTGKRSGTGTAGLMGNNEWLRRVCLSRYSVNLVCMFVIRMQARLYLCSSIDLLLIWHALRHFVHLSYLKTVWRKMFTFFTSHLLNKRLQSVYLSFVKHPLEKFWRPEFYSNNGKCKILCHIHTFLLSFAIVL
jgi:hypothetical protein